MTLDDLCSPAYRAQLHEMAAKRAWSGGGTKYVDELARLCTKADAQSVLDYGCGFVDLANELRRRYPHLFDYVYTSVQSFDPGIPGREQLPEPADVVMCVDCLEHVEPDKVQNVLKHIYDLTLKCALIVISTRPAEKRLPDGRNAHLTIDNAGWWLHQLRDQGAWKCRVILNDAYGIHMWWRKLASTNELVIQ